MGTTRRDLLKKGAVAAGVAWAAPVLQTGTAWAQEAQDNCACTNGFIIYTKYSGKSTNSGSTPAMNQCLDPIPNAVGVPFACLVSNGIVHTGTVTNADRQARLHFGTGVYLMKTAMKATNDCYVITCADGFIDVYRHDKSSDEAHGQIEPVKTPPIFTFNDGACGHATSNGPCGQIENVLYDTTELGNTGGGESDPLNFIELLLCLPGTSKPPTC